MNGPSNRSSKGSRIVNTVVKQDWHLARRELLKGLGVGAACLPLLKATRSYAQTNASPRKLVIFQMSEGLRMAGWKPNAGSLMGQTLPSSVTAFEPHKAETMFLHGMNNPGGGGGHGSYGCVYYGLGGTGGGQYKEPTGKTLDQVVAGALGAGSSGRLSLNLHVQLERAPRSTTSPGGSRCFWTGQGQPINPQGDPNVVYREIFAGGDTNPNANPEEIKRLQVKRKSVLDYIGSTLNDFQSRLGREDKESVGAHLQSIRELEAQLTSQPAGDGKCGGQPGPINVDDGASYPLILKAHMSLMLAALKCGVTKVATLQTGDSSGNNINFAFVDGIPARSKNNYKSPFRNWHDLGHNPVMDGVDHKRIVDKWFMDRWAEFVTQMKATSDAGGGTMLDNSIVVIGNHVEDGGSHNSNALPWMLVGKGGGNRLNLGNMISGGGNRIAAVMAGICGAYGINMHPYGNPLNGMLKG